MADQTTSWRYIGHQRAEGADILPYDHFHIKQIRSTEVGSRGIDLGQKGVESKAIQFGQTEFPIKYVLSIDMHFDGHRPRFAFPGAVANFALRGVNSLFTLEDNSPMEDMTASLLLNAERAYRIEGVTEREIYGRRMSAAELEALRDIFLAQLGDFGDQLPRKSRFGRAISDALVEGILGDLQRYYKAGIKRLMHDDNSFLEKSA